MVGAFQVFFEGWIFIFLALCAVGIIALLVGALWSTRTPKAVAWMRRSGWSS